MHHDGYLHPTHQMEKKAAKEQKCNTQTRRKSFSLPHPLLACSPLVILPPPPSSHLASFVLYLLIRRFMAAVGSGSLLAEAGAEAGAEAEAEAEEKSCQTIISSVQVLARPTKHMREANAHGQPFKRLPSLSASTIFLYVLTFFVSLPSYLSALTLLLLLQALLRLVTLAGRPENPRQRWRCASQCCACSWPPSSSTWGPSSGGTG